MWAGLVALAGGLVGAANVLVVIFLVGRRSAQDESYERRIRRLMERD